MMELYLYEAKEIIMFFVQHFLGSHLNKINLLFISFNKEFSYKSLNQLIISAWSVLTETEEPTILISFWGTDKEPEPIFP